MAAVARKAKKAAAEKAAAEKAAAPPKPPGKNAGRKSDPDDWEPDPAAPSPAQRIDSILLAFPELQREGDRAQGPCFVCRSSDPRGLSIWPDGDKVAVKCHSENCHISEIDSAIQAAGAGKLNPQRLKDSARKARRKPDSAPPRDGDGNDPPPGDGDDRGDGWHGLHWVLTGGKDPKPKDGSTLNSVRALIELGEADRFRFNQWTQRIEYAGAEFDDAREIPRLTFAAEKAFGYLGYTPGKEAMLSAVRQVAHQAEYHPVQDAVKAVQWDGIKRLDTFGHHAYGLDLYDVLGNLTVALIPRGMIARLFRPGSRFPYIPILRSDKQGVGKRDGLATLCGEENYAQGIPFGAHDFTKKVQERGRGKLIIEIGEIHALPPEKLAQAKALATDRSTNDRDAYARNSKDNPFTFVPVGTTNDKRFLSDITGNRRHPVINVPGAVNLQWIENQREQMFAEAYMEFQRGDYDHGVALPEELWQDASDDSELYQVENHYDVWVDGYIARMAGAAAEQAEPLEITGIKLMEDAKQSMGTINYPRIAEALRRAGWESSRIKIDGRQVTVWKPQ